MSPWSPFSDVEGLESREWKFHPWCVRVCVCARVCVFVCGRRVQRSVPRSPYYQYCVPFPPNPLKLIKGESRKEVILSLKGLGLSQWEVVCSDVRLDLSRRSSLSLLENDEWMIHVCDSIGVRHVVEEIRSIVGKQGSFLFPPKSLPVQGRTRPEGTVPSLFPTQTGVRSRLKFRGKRLPSGPTKRV